MAKAQIKPTSGGSFNDATGKSATGISNLPPAQQAQALLAANCYAIGQGAGDWGKRGTKLAAAVGRVLQWV